MYAGQLKGTFMSQYWLMNAALVLQSPFFFALYHAVLQPSGLITM